MADRYQHRLLPSDDYGRGGDQHGRAESDPLAELARLIGQTDPFATQGGPAAKTPAPPVPEPYQPPAQDYSPEQYQDSYDEPPPPGPPSWMRRANVQPQPAPPVQQDYVPSVNPAHPRQRYVSPQAAPEPQYHQSHPEPAYSEHEEPADPSRYDDALYGQVESGLQDFQRDPAYPDDPYAYQNDYPEGEFDDEVPQKKRGGLMTVAAILALAVVGTGGAFAYKTYLGSPRSGEPPIIRADNTPTKIMSAPTDGSVKVPDRMVTGDGSEKIVPREEAPVDINAKSGGPRVVFPPLNPNANPPPVVSVAPSTVPPPNAGPVPNNGTLPNNEPRRIRTLAVKGDQTDSTTAPTAAAAKPTAAPKVAAVPAAPHNPPTSANASATQPLSLAPQGGPSEAPPQVAGQKMAAANPTQLAPASSGAGGGYVVQVSSQLSEESAQASYRVLQSKYGSVLGSRSAVVKRVDLSDKGKGIVYRAFAGPFASQDEAVQVCNSLKSAGLPQCFVQRN
jgi:SPOR domain